MSKALDKAFFIVRFISDCNLQYMLLQAVIKLVFNLQDNLSVVRCFVLLETKPVSQSLHIGRTTRKEKNLC